MIATILVIDDDADICDLIRQILEDEGYDVMIAANGQIALEVLATIAPSLILLDYMMPLMDGPTFIHETEQRGLRDTIPIVLLTAASAANQRAAELGTANYVGKPFELESLLQAVENSLKAA